MHGCHCRSHTEKARDDMKDGIHPDGYIVTNKQTNADRIRNMTDEELAEWFDTVTKDVLGGSTWNKKGWLKWLREESEE